MKTTTIITALILLLTSCGGNSQESEGRPSQEQLKSDIQQMDDSLKLYYADVMNNKAEQVPVSAIEKTIDLHLAYYHHYPKDTYSAECLDKVQQLYIQEKLYGKSARTCDTLLAKYPSYKNKAEVLLSAATTYDYFLRDIPMARKYYEKVLTSKKIDKETKESIAYRLQHLDLTLDEMIELQMKEVAK